MKALTDPAFGLLSVVKHGIMEAPVSGLSRDSVYGGHVMFVTVPGQRHELLYLQDGVTSADGERVGFLVKVLSRSHGLVCIDAQ